MKRNIVFILSTFLAFCLFGQNDLKLNFQGVDTLSGGEVTLDSVLIKNVNSGFETVLEYPFNANLIFELSNGLSELSPDNDWQIYPNPITSHSIIKISNQTNNNTDIKIYDIQGKTIANISRSSSTINNQFEFYPPNTGVFIVSVNGISKTVISKIGSNSGQVLKQAEHNEKNRFQEHIKSVSLENNPNITYNPNDVFKLIGYASGYSPDSLTVSPQIDSTYTFKFANPYFYMHGFKITTEHPSFVNVMFSVTDANLKGVKKLTNNNFIVKEDGAPISKTESFRYFRKLDSLDYQLNTALFIDNSASIGNDLPAIKNAAIEFVRKIHPYQKIAVYVFSDAITKIHDYSNDISSLELSINSIIGGYPSTNLYGAVIEGCKSLDDLSNPDKINKGFLVVFTDGDDTQGSSTLQQAISARGQNSVFVMAPGSGINTAAMNSLSSYGPYLSYFDMFDLSQTFIRIQGSIRDFADSFYILNYMSPKRSGTHSLEISLNPNNNGNATYTGTFDASKFKSVFGGVYANVSPGRDYGEDSVSLLPAQIYPFDARTFWAYKTPEYVWSVEDSTIATVDYKSNNAVITCTEKLGTTKLVLSDTANNYTTYIAIHNRGRLPVVDNDGNKYKTVTIGTQEWMAENLKNTFNLTRIDEDSKEYNLYWNKYDYYGAYSYVQFDEKNKYRGVIYNWPAVNLRSARRDKICPSGWHVPSEDEWKTLTDYLGGGAVAGYKLTSKNASGWKFPNSNATDETGFNAKPTPFRRESSAYIESHASYWTTTPDENDFLARVIQISGYENYNNRIAIKNYERSTGHCVRCVRD